MPALHTINTKTPPDSSTQKEQQTVSSKCMTPVEHLSSNEEELSGDSPLPRALRQQPRSHVQENMAEQRKNQSGDSPLPSSIKDEHRSAMTRQQSRSRVVSAEHCYALTESMAKQTKKTIKTFFALPFNDLLFQAQAVHRQHHDPNAVQASTLLNIKSGGCQEDCAYCPQAARYNTGVEAEKLLDADTVLQAAKSAKNAGASRFCMGAAWRELKDRDLPKLATMIEGVKSLGLESCMTLGMLKKHQANALKEAGLDYYNHNLDTSPEFYGDIISTRTYRDRLDTLEHVRDAGMKTCCGGIVGMGESVDDRIGLLHTLANLPKPPESIPINMLVRIEGTPLAEQEDLDIFDFIRTIAVARILMPKSYVRLSAGREQMTDEAQALCFLAGANSIFYGDTLLTTSNPQVEKDQALLERLGMRLESLQQDD